MTIDTYAVVLQRGSGFIRVLGPMTAAQAKGRRERILREARLNGDDRLTARTAQCFPHGYVWDQGQDDERGR